MTTNKSIRDAVKNVSGVEFLDLDSFRLEVDFTPEETKAVLTFDFDGFLVSLRPLMPPKTKFIDLVAELRGGSKTIESAAFTIGYNDQTKKPQLNWHEGIPEDLSLRVAVDVVVACFFEVLKTVPFPIPLGTFFPKMEPYLHVVK